MIVDFHIHTSASDGSLSPEEVVCRGCQGKPIFYWHYGITYDGQFAARLPGKRLNVEIIPVLNSVHFKKRRDSYSGLFLPGRKYPPLKTIGSLSPTDIPGWKKWFTS